MDIEIGRGHLIGRVDTHANLVKPGSCRHQMLSHANTPFGARAIFLPAQRTTKAYLRMGVQVRARITSVQGLAEF